MTNPTVLKVILPALAAFALLPAMGDELAPEAQAAAWFRLKNDSLVIRRARNDLAAVIRFMKENPALFPAEKVAQPPALTREQRLAIWNTWQAFLDPMVILDGFVRSYNDLQGKANGDLKKSAFRTAFAATLAQYRYALDFIALAENNPDLHTVLNEPVPELGLPARTYAKLKFRFLNVLLATEFARLNVVHKFYSPDTTSPLSAGLEEDKQVIWAAGKGPGPLATAENALQIAKDTGFSVWFPVQKEVAEWMGDTKVWRLGKSLVTPQQVCELEPRLEPGDVILVRHEWFLSNVGLPGFWPHAALHIGTPRQRRAYFQDATVTDWVKKQQRDADSFEALLCKQFADTYKANQDEQGTKPLPRVIEALSEGVIFTTLEHCLNVDSAVVLRPRLSKLDKAQAILRAFHYTGRPYDFSFDFLTDAELVCTELVCKSYEPAQGMTGLRLPMITLAGRTLLPANEIARIFTREAGTAQQQLDLVLFLDGHESEGVAVPAGLEEFRVSCERPKWHVLVQDDLPRTAPAP